MNPAVFMVIYIWVILEGGDLISITVQNFVFDSCIHIKRRRKVFVVAISHLPTKDFVKV